MPVELLTELDVLRVSNTALYNQVRQKVGTMTEWKRNLTEEEAKTLVAWIQNEKANIALETYFNDIRKDIINSHPLWYSQHTFIRR